VSACNSQIAEAFDRTADLLEIEGASPLAVRAYRNAARTIAALSSNVAYLVAQHEDLSELPGISTGIVSEIAELVQTGTTAQIEEIQHRVSPGLVALAKTCGLGRKRFGSIIRELDVSTLEELEEAARRHRICQIPGFGEKTEAKVLDATLRARCVHRNLPEDAPHPRGVRASSA
jgi:DNA polymerase (family 10)